MANLMKRPQGLKKQVNPFASVPFRKAKIALLFNTLPQKL